MGSSEIQEQDAEKRDPGAFHWSGGTLANCDPGPKNARFCADFVSVGCYESGMSGDSLEELETDDTSQKVVRLKRTENLWDARSETAVQGVLVRFLSDGSFERMEMYEPEGRIWLDRFPLPFGGQWVLDHWGSGTYQVRFQTQEKKACGQTQRIELDDPTSPTKPSRCGAAVAIAARGPVAAPVEAALPIASLQKPPKIPEGMDANATLAILSWARQEAREEADRRVVSIEDFYRNRMEAQRMSHLRDVDEQDARARRDREENQARHTRYLSELKLAHDAQLAAAVSQSGRKEMQAQLDELEEALEEREKPAAPEGFMGFLQAAIGPLLSTPEGQAKIAGLVGQLLTKEAPKLG
jgi:hypothetical protein